MNYEQLNTLLAIFALILWYALGILSFVFWWTRDYEYNSKLETVLLSIYIGTLGPICFIIGYFLRKRS